MSRKLFSETYLIKLIFNYSIQYFYIIFNISSIIFLLLLIEIKKQFYEIIQYIFNECLFKK